MPDVIDSTDTVFKEYATWYSYATKHLEYKMLLDFPDEKKSFSFPSQTSRWILYWRVDGLVSWGEKKIISQAQDVLEFQGDVDVGGIFRSRNSSRTLHRTNMAPQSIGTIIFRGGSVSFKGYNFWMQKDHEKSLPDSTQHCLLV